MHSIDVGFGKDRGGSRNDRWNENLMSLAQLADMTSFSIPVNIAEHTGPPKALTDVSFGSVEGFVSKRVMCGADDCKGTSICFLTLYILSHSLAVHMYSPSSPLYYPQGLYPQPTTPRPNGPMTLWKSTHR
jgi:hypothetical protein